MKRRPGRDSAFLCCAAMLHQKSRKTSLNETLAGGDGFARGMRPALADDGGAATLAAVQGIFKSSMAGHDFLPFPAMHEWAVPSHGLQVETVDAHAGGQSLRLILRGVPPLGGRTMVERQAYAERHFDHLRRALLLEPRGHPDLHGCLLTPPQYHGSHFGVIFMHRGGFRPMCGHGVIALTTLLLECGLVEMKVPETRLRLDTPVGMIRAYGQIREGQVERVFFENAPSRVVATGCRREVPGLGQVNYDLAFGGGLFAFVDAGALGLSIAAEAEPALALAGRALLAALAGHPAGEMPESALEGMLMGVVFTGPPSRRRGGRADARQVCVSAGGSVDRSAGGMEICARLALLSSQGLVRDGVDFAVEGITGSVFRGKIVGRDSDPVTGGAICEIEGQAWVTGRHTFLIAEDDPFRSGFLL